MAIVKKHIRRIKAQTITVKRHERKTPEKENDLKFSNKDMKNFKPKLERRDQNSFASMAKNNKSKLPSTIGDWKKGRLNNSWMKKNDTVTIITNMDKQMKPVSYGVEIYEFDKSTTEKTFNNESQAIDYAVKYMKNNPNISPSKNQESENDNMLRNEYIAVSAKMSILMRSAKEIGDERSLRQLTVAKSYVDSDISKNQFSKTNLDIHKSNLDNSRKTTFLIRILENKSKDISGKHLINSKQKENIAKDIHSGILKTQLDVEAEIQNKYHSSIGNKPSKASNLRSPTKIIKDEPVDKYILRFAIAGSAVKNQSIEKTINSKGLYAPYGANYNTSDIKKVKTISFVTAEDLIQGDTRSSQYNKIQKSVDKRFLPKIKEITRRVFQDNKPEEGKSITVAVYEVILN